MRPHTRTQCTNGNHCLECDPGAVIHPSSSAGHGATGIGMCTSSGNYRSILIVELPAELIVKILSYLSFQKISHLRLVSRRFNEICVSMLNSTFQRLQTHMLQRFQTIKAQMPRRESLRRNHPLAREADIVETLHMRLTLLQMTLGKHIERKHVCFFAGEILDEVQRILFYIRQTPCLGRAFKVTDELFDLSTMAMEYFKENIEPTLPEITYFGAEFLDFATPFTSPTKRRSQSGSISAVSVPGIESSASSRASVAGSYTSDVWSSVSGSTFRGRNGRLNGHAGNLAGTSNTDLYDEDVDEDVEYFTATPAPPTANSQTTMVLRKRIYRIRQGMKKYNTQLVEVKRELKSCKTKMESQSKQVQDYSQRLEEYDKKFEESSRKFQTLLTELNKCKTELQYWRSKSTLLLSLPTSCSHCEAPLFPIGTEGTDAKDAEKFASLDLALMDMNDLKTLANQGVYPVSDSQSLGEKLISEPDIEASTSTAQDSSYVKTRSRPNSPTGKAGTSGLSSPRSQPVGGRKRRSRDESCEQDHHETRKSLRGSVATSTRAKKPKLIN